MADDNQVMDSQDLNPDEAFYRAEHSTETLRERFSFLPKILDRFEHMRDPDMQDEIIQQYFKNQQQNRFALYDEGEIEGFRGGAVIKNLSQIYFIGVSDDGLVYQRSAYNETYWPGEAPTMLDLARTLGAAALTGQAQDADPEKGIVRLQSSDGDPLHLTSRSARNSKLIAHSVEAGAARLAAIVEGYNITAAPPVNRNFDEDEDTFGFDEEIAFEADRILNDRATRQFYNIMVSITRKRRAMAVSGAVNHIMKKLDPEVARIMRGTGVYSASAANYLAGGEYVSGGGRKMQVNPVARLYRQQAVRSYPLLAGIIIPQDIPHQREEEQPENNYSPRMQALVGDGPRHLQPRSISIFEDGPDDLRETIEAGGELGKVLAKTFDVSPATIKSIQGKTWQKLGRDAFRAPKPLLKGIEAIGPNLAPQTRKEVAELSAAQDALRMIGDLTSDDHERMLKELGGRYKALAGDLEGNPPVGIMDFAIYLNKKLVIPAVYQKLAEHREPAQASKLANHLMSSMQFNEDASIPALLAGQNPRQIVQNTQRWHIALPRLEDRLTTEHKDDTWAPLAGRVDLGEGRHAEELDSQHKLTKDGLVKHFCVGGYRDAVVSGRSLIYALHVNGHSPSTVELTPQHNEAGETVFEVRQNQGPHNSEPSKEVQAMGRQLARQVSKLPEEQKRGYFAALSSNRANKEDYSQEANLRRRIGYDPADESLTRRAWEELSPLLPKGVRKLGFDSWKDSYIATIAEKVLEKDERVWQRPEDKRSRMAQRGHAAEWF